MLNDATGFQKVFIITGRTDLRYGIDRLAATVEAMTGKKPLVPNTLYLFCGRRSDRIKGLVWERDGYCLVYKRLEAGNFQWPRNTNEVKQLSGKQFRWLMEGLTISPKKLVKEVSPEYLE
jgi:transposase